MRSESGPKGFLGGLGSLLLGLGVLVPLPIGLETVEKLQRTTRGPSITWVAGGLAGCALASLAGFALLARASRSDPDHRARPFDPASLLWVAAPQVFAIAAISIAWARTVLAPPLGGRGTWTMVVSIASAGALVLGGLVTVHRMVTRLRDPARVSSVARAKIHALRAGGASLSEIAAALEAARLAAPGGRWTGLLLRAVIREVPLNPPR